MNSSAAHVVVDCLYCTSGSLIFTHAPCCYARAVVEEPTHARRAHLVDMLRATMPPEVFEATMARAQQRWDAMHEGHPTLDLLDPDNRA